MSPPCVIFEDDHLLVVNKPAGLNTHSPAPFAGEGLYEWLRHREPRWADLAIIHRLDKDTSGLLLFSKTTLANRSLTEQFAARFVRKRYLLLTDRPVPSGQLEVKSSLVRAGDKYYGRSIKAGGNTAVTRFSRLTRVQTAAVPGGTLLEAEPLTGRTHQIRVHAADQGFPILGDTKYGGTPAHRLCLHAAELVFRHPASGNEVRFEAPLDFSIEPKVSLRRALINQQPTTAFRLCHGAGDGWPGWYVDRFGPYLLAQSSQPLRPAQTAALILLVEQKGLKGAYEKRLLASTQGLAGQALSPKLISGPPAPERFKVQENGLSFEINFSEGYSVGLFLDQRDNRRRLLSRHIAAGFPLFETEPRSARPEVLNTFAYTCGFSVCAAKAGARATSLDLSKRYLDWGKDNFKANQLDPAEHDFIFGDVFDWLKRFGRKGRFFDVILLDPPTFSRSKNFGVFRAEQNYPQLVRASLPLLKPRGVLFASSNSARWTPEAFLEAVKAPIRAAKREIIREQYFPQPPDFPISREEPAYLKTAWMRVG